MIKNLLLIRLRSAFLATASGKSKDGKTPSISVGKIIGISFLYLFLVLMFAGLAFLSASTLGMALIPMGRADIYFGLFMSVSFSVVFFFSIFETKSELFDCKDNELLLSMPIPMRAIIISRIFTVLVYNYIIEAVIMIPVCLAYILFGGNLTGIIGSVIVFITLPIIATALAAGVGFLVAVITRKIKHKTFFTVLLSVLFFGVYMVGVMSLSSMPETDEEIVEGIEALLPMLSPFGYIGAAQILSPIPLLILIALCVITAWLAYYFISKNYIKIITTKATSEKRVYVERTLSQKGIISALVRKEFSYVLSSANYILNSGIMAIIAVIGGVIALIKKNDLAFLINQFLELEIGVSVAAAPLVMSAVILLSCEITFSYSALSLEGKNFWILKSMPIPSSKILLAKAIPHIIIGTASTMFLSVCCMIAIGAHISTWAFYIVIPMLANVTFGLLGIFCNAIKPKFDFTNEMQVVKQSLPVMIATFGGMLMGFAIMVAAMIMCAIGMSYLFLIVLTVLLIALSLALYFIITTSSARKLDKISC